MPTRLNELTFVFLDQNSSRRWALFVTVIVSYLDRVNGAEADLVRSFCYYLRSNNGTTTSKKKADLFYRVNMHG
ncbi:hypothetical protein LF1_04440 [Rubripirellula obstinata]|uniref:Uncharacterized protein n=1 Tax=Rubripirellula obstinata TaxID=406547 RepID=A0A5B1CER7_9BACT|nr:hypothetical protein LF1_04440 [Rubripirellula obstinata]